MDLGKNKTGYIIGWASIVLNTVLFGIKLWAGYQIDSVAIIADGWHSLSDTLSSVIVIIGFWIGSRPPDQEHPFGHGRAESIAAIVIATLLALVAYEFIAEAVEKINHGKTIEYNSLAIIVVIFSVISKEVMAQISIIYGRRVGSEALVADGWHHRTDSISSAVILIGIFFAADLWWFDSAMGGVVGLLIFKVAYDIFRKSVSTLLGERAEPGIVNEIEGLIKSVNGDISDVHAIKLHNYGDIKEMTAHMRLPAKYTVEQSFQISTEIYDLILSKKNIRATIHIDPEIKINQ